jgi:hypothetical protein
VTITATTLNNTNHVLDTSSQTSSYHDYPVDTNITAGLSQGETHELEITSLLHQYWIKNATLSAWIDFDQDGEFEGNEWIQVVWIAHFCVLHCSKKCCFKPNQNAHQNKNCNFSKWT